MKKGKKHGRVLFVRHAALGDVLLTTPFLRLVQEGAKGAEADLFSMNAQAMAGVLGFRELLSMQRHSAEALAKWDYDRVYWFSYEHDPTLHILDGYEIATGLKLKDRTLSWSVDVVRRDRFKQRFAGLKRPLIGFSPTSQHALRTLSQAKIQEVVDRVSERLNGSLVVTAQQRLELTGCHNLSAEVTSIQDLGAVIANCDVWVTVDSLPFHVAQALAVPTVGIFGCTLPELRATRPAMLRIVRNENLDCLGCYHHMPPFSEVLPACARGDLACLVNLDAEVLVQAIADSLEGRLDLNLQGRLERYERYKAQRLAVLPEAYALGVAQSYRDRVSQLCGKDGRLKRMERAVRQFRKTLTAWMREHG